MRADKPPRVLVVVQNLPYALDRRVRQECGALVAAGYGVTVICPRMRGERRYRTDDGVVVRSYRPAPKARGTVGYLFEFLYCWIRTALLSAIVLVREGFDVLQACNPPDTYFALAAPYKLLGKRFVYDQHDLCPEVFEARFGTQRAVLLSGLRWLERRTYRAAHHVISTNESYRDVALQRGRLAPEVVSIVRSAPDPAAMCRGAVVPELKRGRQYLACYLGVMGPQDGVDRLLRAIDVYVHELKRDDCTFALLGFGDCERELRHQCADLGLAPWVTFTGTADARMISRYLSTADVGITPDPKNRFNDVSTMNKTLEYMAFELPVLATDLLETRRSTAGEAVLVDEEDDLSFARALAGLLDAPAERHRLGVAGRRRIEGDLSWTRQIGTYVAVFELLLGRTVRELPTRTGWPVPPGAVPDPRRQRSVRHAKRMHVKVDGS